MSAESPTIVDPEADISDLVVVILNWNRAEATLRCVDSVVAAGVHPSQIVVVDNGSDLACIQQLMAVEQRGITLLRVGANLGYSGGNNVGIAWALARPSTTNV